MTKQIAVLVGSLREESYNRKIAESVIDLAPDSLSFEFVEIGDLPLYNEDLDNDNPPQQWVNFREQLKSRDGFLFFTPEYNRTVPGALKNAIDVGSRPYGKSIWQGKPGGIGSVSISPLGAFGANHSVRQCMVHLDVFMLQQPELYIGNAKSRFGEDGKVVDDTKKVLQEFITAFAKWVEKF